MEKEKEIIQNQEADANVSGNNPLNAANNEADDQHASNEEEDHEHVDYGSLSKGQLVEAIEELVKKNDFSTSEKNLKELKAAFDEIKESEKQKALDKFIADGGEEDDFEYRGDEETKRFDAAYRLYRERKSQHSKDQEKQKDKNLVTKNNLLEKLRGLIDAEETKASINVLKEIQKEWQNVGPVPAQFAKPLWASYNALITRFYDNRSIYFELKELDRKKNLEAKQDICEKAEKLVDNENIFQAIRELNDLHEEYKNIGPVPTEEQEKLWLRFKSASDKVYSRRKDFTETLKEQQQQNVEKKNKVLEKILPFVDFTSDRINEWNKKTKEIQELQKEWEATGGVSREAGKELNKNFWSAFKTFFNNKNSFFKVLEGHRAENLEKKEALVAKAEALKENTDFESTAETIKTLQREWKEIGPVPEKFKDEVFEKFKKACDFFFEQRRAKFSEVEKEYVENLKKKETICEQIEKLAEKKSSDFEKLSELQEEWKKIGFVPKEKIKSIQKRYTTAIDQFVGSAKGMDDQEKQNAMLSIEINKLKAEPNSDQKIHRKESAIRKQIHAIENDIALWKNNLEFFASSKTADKLRVEFDKKIADANQEIEQLKEQIRIIHSLED